MNTKNLSTKSYLVLSLLTLVMIGLAGCGTLEVGAIQADATESEDVQSNGIEVGIEPTPMPETLSYTNEFYGFKFDYPETWTLSEEDHGVVLRKRTNRLGINYRWVNEMTAPFRTGMAGGTPVYSDKIIFLDQVLPVYIVELEHLAKYVLYGENGKTTIADLVFILVLEDLESDYMTFELPEDVIAEAKTILESFERIEALGTNPETAPSPEPTSKPEAPEEVAMDMSVYENREYGFQFTYPTYMSVVDESNKVLVIDKANCQMTIAYRRAEESIQITDAGEVTGQLVAYGEVTFLGTRVQPFLEIQDQLIKAAFLGEPGAELGEGTPLRLVVSLVNIEGDRISNAQVDAMLMIFENFGLASWSE